MAGLEALIALRQMAAERASITLIAPTDDFLIRALSVETPFAHPSPRRYGLAEVCREHGATFRHDAVHQVVRETSCVIGQSGEEVGFDSLLIAVGAQPSPAYPQVTTFRGLQDAEAVHGIVQDLEGGYSTSIAFVVPPGTTWTLPLYELALMTAERADAMGVAVSITIVTPESSPLAIFGREASDRVAEILVGRGIALKADTHVHAVAHGTVFAGPGELAIEAQRVVALPRLNGPRIAGLPADAEGFLPVDEYGRVVGTDDVFGAGDGTTNPIKQGGVAAQQALSAAESIAARVGTAIEPTPFRPVLRAELLTGARSTYLREHVAGGGGAQTSTAAEHPLWWPPSKVVAPHLASYLFALDERMVEARSAESLVLHAQSGPGGGIEVA